MIARRKMFVRPDFAGNNDHEKAVAKFLTELGAARIISVTDEYKYVVVWYWE